MSRVLHRLGGACARRPYPVLAVWIVAVIAIAVVSRAVGENTSDDLSLPGTESTAATDLLENRLPAERNGTVPIVIQAPSGRIDSGDAAGAVEKTMQSLRKTPEVREAVSPLSDEGSDQLTKDGSVGYVAVSLRESQGSLTEDEANAVIAATHPATEAGLEVSAGGYLGQEVSQPSTRSSEGVGVGFAIVILSFTFGTFVAMTLPIATAIGGLVIGLGLVTLLGHLIDVPSVAPTLGEMIGLGVGIDYSLFIVTRHRELLREGKDIEEAIAGAIAGSGSAVAFAGGTVVIALLSLVFADIPIVSALGYSAALVVAVAVAAALTLLPALLSILGRRIDSLRVPFTSAEREEHPKLWARWAQWVAARPVPAMAAAVVLLVALALPLFGIRLGQQDIGQFPESTTARQAYDGINSGFGAGTNGPFLVAVRFQTPAHNDQKSLNKLTRQQQAAAAEPSQAQQSKEAQQEAFLKSTASDPRLVKLQKRISKAGDVKSVGPAKLDDSGSAAVFSVIPTSPPSSEATSDLVSELRDTVIPDALRGTDLEAYVGGVTAAYIDLADRIGDKLPQVIAVVVALSFLLLMVAFRSLLVPLTAALMNLLSVAAAYGVLTAVFEKGFGAELIGLDHSIPIVSFVPLLMFAILFGLSMDYQVFLLTRIQQHYRADGDNTKAVTDGLATSARVITSAALIMVSVFTSFVLNGDPTVKQFGVGLAVAIAVDATIVRCLLVPSVMILLGKANWWLPRRLDRLLPRMGIDE